MARTKTTEMSTITAAQLADGDWVPVVDVSDTTMSSTGTNKKLAKSQLAEAAGVTAHAAVTSGVHGISAFGATLVDDADAATARSTLGLGTIATQAAGSVAITGGSVTGITDLAVADGGTGGSTAAAALANLTSTTLAADGDILTRSGGSPAAITRANLAADTAFTSRFAPVYNPMAYGAAGDGTTDDTIAVQAAITACPVGGSLLIDRRYKVSSLTCNKAIAFVGHSFNNTVVDSFGNANWDTASAPTGSVLNFTATSGSCLAVTTYGQVVFENIALLGPGSGTSIGLAITSSRFSLTNVLVANFSTGVQLTGMNEAVSSALRCIGNETGLSLTGAANNNFFFGTAVEKSSTYAITFSTNSSNNAFVGGLVQNCAGTAGLHIRGLSNNFIGAWWFENNTTTNIIDIPSGSGGRARLTDFYISGTNAVRIQGNGVTCESWIGQGGTTTITNTGVQNIFIQCDSPSMALTDSGSDTTIISTGSNSKVRGLTKNTEYLDSLALRVTTEQNLTTSLATVGGTRFGLISTDWATVPGTVQVRGVLIVAAGGTPVNASDVLEVEIYDLTAAASLAAGTLTVPASPDGNSAYKVVTAWLAVPATRKGCALRARNQTGARGACQTAQLEFRYV